MELLIGCERQWPSWTVEIEMAYEAMLAVSYLHT